MDNEEMIEENCLEDSEDSLEGALGGWTKEEKFNLLEGLKLYGSNGVQNISQLFDDKDETAIKEAIDFYRRKITSKTVVTTPNKKKGPPTNTFTSKSVPLSSWAKILTDTYPYKELQTETVTALRFIANFEDIPDHSLTGNINFKELYHTLADAIEGKTLSTDIDIMVIMQKCLLETAFDSKSFIKQSSLQTLLDSVNLKNKDLQFPRPTDSVEVATLQHLSTKHTYNPFSIPEENLKPSNNIIIAESLSVFDD